MLKNRIRSIVVLSLMLLASSSFCFAQKKYTPKSYIEQHSGVAKQLMRETGVPASVILAVAFHESAYGTSRVANHLNNHFGIKGKNNSKKIKSAYKGYDSVMASYRDFVNLLKRKKSTQPLFEKKASTNYSAWVKSIARSGYSQTGDWSRKVIATIDRYGLDQYDEEVPLN